ncbi:MAG: IS5 family transposase [Bacteroidales bacterium]|nr:IS5 family transposase [Bacteroidales bacterium]
MIKAKKKRAPTPLYVSPAQFSLDCFKTPFEQHLNFKNRWIVLAKLIPWDEISNLYLKHVGVSDTGRPPLNPRVVLGSLMIKHLCNLDDRETVDQISENIYMQYFLGYSSFTSEAPFDASLFVEFRKRLGMDTLNAINEKIASLKTHLETKEQETTVTTDMQSFCEKDSNNAEPLMEPKQEADEKQTMPMPDLGPLPEQDSKASEPKNKGRIIFDATACPQDIAYPTDLDLLSDARKKSEELIDVLYSPALHEKKPRTYREIGRKLYLKTAQKKNKSRKQIRKAVGSQLRLLKRNLKSINSLLDAYPQIPLKPKDYKYLLVINTFFEQQQQMYDSRSHRIDDRIVSIHQPHVRPIVRGKSQAKVEFGAKIHVSVIDGITFLDELSWDAFNEGNHMMDYVEKYYQRFGCYPRELLADQIYCTRANRAALKEKGIKLLAKPLGRPSAVQVHVSPGERNPIEGKFGQAKTAYGLNRIKARLRDTSESWIASIILVLNLVKLAGAALPCFIVKLILSFSAKGISCLESQNPYEIKRPMIFNPEILYSHRVQLKIVA